MAKKTLLLTLLTTATLNSLNAAPVVSIFCQNKPITLTMPLKTVIDQCGQPDSKSTEQDHGQQETEIKYHQSANNTNMEVEMTFDQHDQLKEIETERHQH